MKTVTVELTQPIDDFFGMPVSRITIREPTYRMYAALGEPYTYGRTVEGTEFATARDTVISGYLDQVVVEPKDASVLQFVSNVKDARALRHGLLSFFHVMAAEDTSEKPQG